MSVAEYPAHKPLTTPGTDQTDLSIFTDPRLDVSAGRFGVPYQDYGIPSGLSTFVRDSGNGGVYLNKKQHGWKAERAGAATTNPTSTAMNYHVIRFADILLMRAEVAYFEKDYTTVINIVNQIRARAAKGFVAAEEGTVGSYSMENLVDGKTVAGAAANYRIGLYPASYATADKAWDALEREIRLEFGMEGHRWFDIARWGKAAERLNAYAKAESKYLGKFINTYQTNWVNFPIPQSEIQTAQGRFVQTPAWK